MSLLWLPYRHFAVSMIASLGRFVCLPWVWKSHRSLTTFEHSLFVLDKWKDEDRGLSNYTVSANVFKHISLQYRLVTPYCAFGWAHFLGRRLHSYAKLGLLATMPSERPACFGENGVQATEDLDVSAFFDTLSVREFKKPIHWRLFNDQIPRWFDQWYSLIDPKRPWQEVVLEEDEED